MPDELELYGISRGVAEHLHQPAFGQLERHDISRGIGVHQPLARRERDEERRADFPSEPISRLFDGSVNPLFNSVLVCPSTVTRQNVLSGKRGARGERHALRAAAVDRRAEADIVAAAAAEGAVGSGRVDEVAEVGQILRPAGNQRFAEAEDDRGDRLAVHDQLLRG